MTTRPYALFLAIEDGEEVFRVAKWSPERELYLCMVDTWNENYAQEVLGSLSKGQGVEGTQEPVEVEQTLSEPAEGPLEPKLIRNSAVCVRCGDSIESKHPHDWVSCSCGSIFVDGGLEYMRRGSNDPSDLMDTSLWTTATPENKEIK
jgi:hypothetical protein